MTRGAEIPVIDVGGLRTERAGAVIDAVDRACTDTGFFVITGHGLDQPLGAVFDVARSFFALPDADKARSGIIGNDGYMPAGTKRTGNKEMFDIGMGTFDRWPALSGFADAVEAYQRAALSVAADLLEALAIALDESPRFFADRMVRAQCFVRMIRAPAQPEAAAGDLVTGAHTDYGAITLLATDGVAGLEVRPVGGEWCAVAIPPGGVVVNLGDMLARWTNDRYVSTPHRVVPNPASERYSVPFFVNPDPRTIVECIPSCVTAEHPCRYAPITAGDFLQGRIDGTIVTGDGVHG